MDMNKECVQKRLDLHAQNLLSILGSVVNIIGEDLHDQFKRKRIFPWKMK